MTSPSHSPRFVDPACEFGARPVVVAPHMDDESLACGGTIARLCQMNSDVQVVFTTDGSRSPAPDYPWQRPLSGDLSDVRRLEATSALGALGVAPDRIRFLDYPDGRLKRFVEPVSRELRLLLESERSDVVFTPFRFDRHKDHIATFEATMKALEGLRPQPRVVEYFVYYRWKLIPGGDVRRLVRGSDVVQVDTSDYSHRKLQALRCYRSQTTRWFAWQSRPILPPERIADVAMESEWFLLPDGNRPGAEVFDRWKSWISLVHQVEPVLKRQKDLILSLPSSLIQRLS